MQFRNQYTIAKNLHSSAIVQTYSLEAYQNGYALVMEDFDDSIQTAIAPKLSNCYALKPPSRLENAHLYQEYQNYAHQLKRSLQELEQAQLQMVQNKMKKWQAWAI